MSIFFLKNACVLGACVCWCLSAKCWRLSVLVHELSVLGVSSGTVFANLERGRFPVWAPDSGYGRKGGVRFGLRLEKGGVRSRLQGRVRFQLQFWHVRFGGRGGGFPSGLRGGASGSGT